MDSLPVILVTGFLGAGKTTFINEMLSYLKQEGKSPALLINEFGKINIDAELIKEDYPIYEVNQGSIFCVCTRDQFINAMTEIIGNDQQFDMVVIEATGIADPASLKEYLDMPPLAGKVEITANYCIIDAANFHKIKDTLPAATNQVKAASVCIINKIDLVESDYLSELGQQLSDINETAKVIETNYGKVNFANIFPDISQKWSSSSHLKKTPPEAIYTVTLEVKGILDRACLEQFLETRTSDLLRAKGFIKFKEGWHYLEWSGERWEISKLRRDSSKDNNISEIVLIGGKMDEEKLQIELEKCLI